MKLPSRNMGGVQSLGREDVGAPAREWAANAQASNALGAAFGKLGDVIVDIEDKETKLENTKAEAHLRSSMAGLSAKYEGMKEVDVNDPNLVGVKFNKKNADGTPKKFVPIHEVYDQLYANASKKNMAISREMITNEGGQVSWDNKFNPIMDENIAKKRVYGLKQKNIYLENEQSTIIDTLYAEGRYKEMDYILDGNDYFGSGAKKEYYKTKIEIGRANDHHGLVEASGRPDAMLAEAAQLRNQENDYPFSIDKRTEMAMGLEKLAKITTETNADSIAHTNVQKLFSDETISDREKIDIARNEKDPTVSSKMLAGIKQRIAYNKQLDIDEGQDIFKRNLDAIKKGGSAVMISPKEEALLTSDQIKQLQTAKHLPYGNFGSVEADNIKYLELSGFAFGRDKTEEQFFMSRDIRTITANWVDRVKADELVDQWESLHKAQKSGVNVIGSTAHQLFTRAIESTYLISASDVYKGGGDNAADAINLKNRFDAEILEYARINKKNPDSVWMRQRLDEITLDIQVKGAVWGTNTTPMFQVESLRSNPNSDRAVRDLLADGIALKKISEQMILDKIGSY